MSLSEQLYSQPFSTRFRAISEQFSFNFRAVCHRKSRSSPCDFRALFEQFQSSSLRVVLFRFWDDCRQIEGHFAAFHRQPGANFWLISQRFQSSFRAFYVQFQCNVRVISDSALIKHISTEQHWNISKTLKNHIAATTPEQFPSSFRAVSEQFPSSSIRDSNKFHITFQTIAMPAIKEQLPGKSRALSDRFQSNYRAIKVQLQLSPFQIYSRALSVQLKSNSRAAHGQHKWIHWINWLISSSAIE